MLRIEYNTMLVIVDIGRILHTPVLATDGDGQDTVVLPGRMVHPTGVALILPTQQTLGVAALGRILCRGDGLGVFLRLR